VVGVDQVTTLEVIDAAERVSLPLWRSARRLQNIGVCLVVLAGAYVLVGLLSAADVVLTWHDSARWATAAGILLLVATLVCGLLAMAFAAQAAARAILEREE
jgi:hypothetical protein